MMRAYREDIGAGRGQLWLDPAIVGRATAREGGHAVGIVRGRVALQRRSAELVWPAVAPAFTRAAGVVAAAGTQVLRGTHGDHVFCGPRLPDRIRVDHPVAVSVGAAIAGGEENQHVLV